MDKNTYTAGFFDGEGYIGIGFRGRLEIRICNTNKNVLEKMKEWWGGNVYTRKPQKNRKQTYDWVFLERNKIDIFLDSIYSHLLVKKEQIDSAIEKEKLC